MAANAGKTKTQTSVTRAKTALGVFLRTSSVSLRILPVENITPPTGSDENSAIKWKWGDKCICNLDDDVNLSEPPEHRFTKVFGPEVGTPEIYNSVVKPIVVQLKNRNDGIVMCYGPSKSGKSHTIQGILPLVTADLLQSFAHTPGHSLNVSVLAIYDEIVLDLLNGAQEITLKDTSDSRAECVGLCKRPIASVNDIRHWLDVGKDTVERNGLSRSHNIVQLIVENGQSTRPVTMSFIDLAGSDSSTTTNPTPEETLEQLRKNQTISGSASASNSNNYIRPPKEREENSIRLSLMALDQVVKLARQNGYVPFRGSQLTRLLSSMWSPTTNMTTICTVNPIEDKKTRSTLTFAGFAKRIAVVQSAFKEEIETTIALSKSLEKFSTGLGKFGALALASIDRNEDCQLDDTVLFYKQMMRTLTRDMVSKLTAMVAMVDEETPMHVVNPPGVVKPSPSKKPLQTALDDLQRTSSAQDGHVPKTDEAKNELDSDLVVYQNANDRLAEFARLSAEWIDNCQKTLGKYSKSVNDDGEEVERLQKLLLKEQQEMQATKDEWNALAEKGQRETDDRIAELNQTITRQTNEYATLKEEHRQALRRKDEAYAKLESAIERYYEEKKASKCFRMLRSLFAKRRRDANYRPWHRFMNP